MNKRFLILTGLLLLCQVGTTAQAAAALRGQLDDAKTVGNFDLVLSNADAALEKRITPAEKASIQAIIKEATAGKTALEAKAAEAQKQKFEEDAKAAADRGDEAKAAAIRAAGSLAAGAGRGGGSGGSSSPDFTALAEEMSNELKKTTAKLQFEKDQAAREKEVAIAAREAAVEKAAASRIQANHRLRAQKEAKKIAGKELRAIAKEAQQKAKTEAA